jgi:hypothetical protein
MAVFLKLSYMVVCRQFWKKIIAKIVSDTERMKNTRIHVCAKTAFVG